MEKKYLSIVHGTIGAILLIFPLFLTAQKSPDSDLLSSVNAPFDMPVMRAPVFPDRTFDIRDFGAIGDGATVNTDAFASAITACADAGGGKVLIPEGIWFTGPIHLKSNINLHIAQGAEVRFSNNPDDYLPVVFTRLEGIECYNYSPLIYAIDCNNIAITGKGVFNGQGEPWWPWKKKQKKAVQGLYDSQFNGIPVNRRVYGTQEAALRPPMIQFLNCRNILLEDYTSKNSPFWTTHLVYCDHVIVRNIRLLNPEHAPNTDGLNLDSSRNVYIQGLFADVGDDAICIKSGMNEDGWRVGRPSENIIVENCLVKKGHGGIVFGSDMSGGIRNVFVQNCEYDGTLMGIRMKSMRGRGGYIENVWIEDIKMNNIGWHAIILNMFYGASSATSRSDTPPQFHNIHIKNVTCQGARDAITLRGLPEENIENITLENITINAENGLIASDALAVKLINVNITPDQGAVMSLQDCQNISIQGSGIPIVCDTFLLLKGEKTGNIRLIDNDLSSVRHEVIMEKEVPADAVLITNNIALDEARNSDGKWPNTIDLNGEWDFTYTHDRQNKPPANSQFKATMIVPGCWDDSFYHERACELWPDAQFNPEYLELKLPVTEGFDTAPDGSLPYLLGAGWYHRSLDVPDDWQGRQVVLNMGRVVMEAFVYLNGKQIHHHLGHSTPWEAVLSTHLEYGKKNELVICVDNHRDDRLGTVIRGWKGRSAGIFGPVSIKVSGPARIADLFISEEGDQLAWQVELEGNIPANAQLRWRVFDPKSGIEYGKGKQAVKDDRVYWSTGEMEIPYWSDRDPQLVEVQVELIHKTRRYDEVRQPFGLRRFTREGTGLYLNGHPVFLRGVCEHSYFPETTTPPLDPEWYRLHIQSLKEVGFNWIRGHTWSLTEPYLKAADELGMLIQVEPPLGYEMDEWLDIILSCRKHPSVVIYCPGNEEMLDELKIDFLRSCADTLKSLSPNALFMPQEAMRGVEYRLEGVQPQQLFMNPFPHQPVRLEVLQGFSDVFGQYALGWLSYISLQGSPEEVDRRLAIYKRPILSHELGITGTFLDLSLEERYKSSRIGPDLFSKVRASLDDAGLLQRAERYYKNSVAWHMLITKHVCEKARRSPYIAGYDMLGANDGHWPRSGYACGLLNEFDEFKAGGTAAGILRFNGASILMIDRHKERNLIAGQSLKRDMFVSWFGDKSLPVATLRWSLVTPGGEVLGHGEMKTQPVLQGQSERIGTINILLPAVEKAEKASLQVVLTAPGVELENQWNYWIFPCIMPKSNDNVLVVSKLDSIALQRLSQGGRVLLLGHKPFTATLMNFQIGISGRIEGNLATLIEKHPLTDRFPHDGFCDWQFAPMLDEAAPVQFNDLDLPFDPVIEVVGTYKQIRKQALVFEWSVGEGRLLVCGLNLNKADPAADYFRRILFDYAAGDEFLPQTQVSMEALAKITRLKVPALQKKKETDKGFDKAGQLHKKKDH